MPRKLRMPLCALLLSGCATFTPVEKQTLIERGGDMACVLANDMLPTAEAVRVACNLEPLLLPEIEHLLFASHKAAAMRAAKAASP